MLGFFSMTLKLCTLCPLVAGKTFAYFRPCYAKSGCAAAILSVRAFLPSRLRTAVPPSQIIWNAVVAAVFRISNDPSDVGKFPSDFGKLRRALLFQKNPQFGLRSSALLGHVVWGKLLGHHTLPDRRAGAVRAGDAREHQEEDPQGGRLLRGAEWDLILSAQVEGPEWLHGAGGGAAGRAQEGTYQRGAHYDGRRAPEPAAHLGSHLPEVLVERWESEGCGS